MYPLSAGLVIADGELSQVVQNCLRAARVRVVLQQAEILRWSEFLVQLERTHPDVLVIEYRASRLEDAIRRIRTVSQAPVIVVHDTVDPATILGALRAGAREYVYPPYEEALLQALARVAGERAQQESAKGTGGQTVGVLSVKGGCGATTIACHLAAELQRLTQKEILLADLAASAGVVSFVMNCKTPYSILDAVQNIDRLDLSYWKALVSNCLPRLEVISCPGEPLAAADLEPERFRDVLRFARGNYDWIIADLGRGLNGLVVSLMEEMDQVFLVTHAEIPAFYQTKNIVQSLRDVGYPEDRLRLLVNRAAHETVFTPQEVERLIGLPVHDRLPNGYPELYRAYAQGRLLNPETQLGKQFTRLARSLIGLQEVRRGPALPAFGIKKALAGWEGA